MTTYMFPKDDNSDRPPNPPSPKRRTWRTAVQVLVGALVAVPSAVALLPIAADLAAWVVGIAGATVLLATGAVNAFDERTGRG